MLGKLRVVVELRLADVAHEWLSVVVVLDLNVLSKVGFKGKLGLACSATILPMLMNCFNVNANLVGKYKFFITELAREPTLIVVDLPVTAVLILFHLWNTGGCIRIRYKGITS